ncbi:MAG: SusC/RagA family TonB-linked outer membrane protein, partial [Candidatus Saccharibacteria bacterium]|nr:SusC/RagA family TonB-linked outer membrane protein [Candidatus Saccharibacteria bacterium]
MQKRFKTIGMLLFLASGLAGTVYAAPAAVDDVKITQQNAACSGTVKDALGDPVIGASVVVKGTTNGAITDFDGNFSLSDVKKGDIIVISFVGYVTQEIKWNGQSLNVTLKDDTQALEEVVVVGYGVEKKVNVVGSISTVSSKKLENRSTPSVTNALTGQMPGVTVRQTSGSPGADGGEIRIRGVGSFGATPSALVLVDGIPGSLTDLHMEDIESISVLKDASTAAIYGSRAANGVILVTTKTGKVGKAKVSYNGYVGFSSATELPKKVDTWEYATLYNIANGSDVYSASDIQKFKDGSDPDNFANSRYLEDLFHTGMQTGHDLSVSGGSESNKYMLSVGYLYQDGIVDKNNYQRFNARLNMVSTLWKNVTLTSRIQGVYGDRKQPNVPYGKDSSGLNAIISNSLRWPGTVPTVLSNGNYGAGEEGYGTSLM